MAILIPYTGKVGFDWSLALRTLKINRNCRLYANKGNPVDIDRDLQVRTALKDGHDWVFFLDSDVIPPEDVIERLASHRLPIVSGMYTAKQAGNFVWSVWVDSVDPSNGAKCFSPVIDFENDKLLKVDGVVGAGCLMVHRKVFEKISELYPDLPFFFWTKDRDPKVFKDFKLPNARMNNASEDFWFCLLARSAGFDIVVDPGVKCGHLAFVELYDLKMRVPGTK